MTGNKIRLDRLLSNLGYGSRKDVTIAIKNRWLRIDGAPVTDPAHIISTDLISEGRILFDGEPLDPPAPMTIMLHKPAGYTCAHQDSGKIIYELLPPRWIDRKPQLSSIGRLDKYSTGQLLITDDGDLLHRIIHPKSTAAKHYRVTLRNPLRGDEAELFSSGNFYMNGDEKPLKAAQWTPDAGDNQSGTMILSEGRYHQIRRMFETIGNEVITLHRFQTGSLPLGDLPEGAWRALSNQDLQLLFRENDYSNLN